MVSNIRGKKIQSYSTNGTKKLYFTSFQKWPHWNSLIIQLVVYTDGKRQLFTLPNFSSFFEKHINSKIQYLSLPFAKKPLKSWMLLQTEKWVASKGLYSGLKSGKGHLLLSFGHNKLFQVSFFLKRFLLPSIWSIDGPWPNPTRPMPTFDPQ